MAAFEFQLAAMLFGDGGHNAQPQAETLGVLCVSAAPERRDQLVHFDRIDRIAFVFDHDLCHRSIRRDLQTGASAEFQGIIVVEYSNGF